MSIKEQKATITMGELMEIMGLVRCANVVEVQHEDGNLTDATMFDMAMHAERVEDIVQRKTKGVMRAS
jgi:hypothetical protein